MPQEKIKALQEMIYKKIKKIKSKKQKNVKCLEEKDCCVGSLNVENVNLRQAVMVPYSTDNEFVKEPQMAHWNDAGSDLLANDDYIIPAGETVLVGTGLRVALPDGTWGAVCSRSGMALKHGVFVLNAPGVIDSGYRGEIGVILHNISKKDFFIRADDKIAQLIVMPFLFPLFNKVDVLKDSERSQGGFGSSGR